MMGDRYLIYPGDPGSPKLRMVEPKYFAEVIGHPNHPLMFGDWMPRDDFPFQLGDF